MMVTQKIHQVFSSNARITKSECNGSTRPFDRKHELEQMEFSVSVVLPRIYRSAAAAASAAGTTMMMMDGGASFDIRGFAALDVTVSPHFSNFPYSAAFVPYNTAVLMPPCYLLASSQQLFFCFSLSYGIKSFCVAVFVCNESTIRIRFQNNSQFVSLRLRTCWHTLIGKRHQGHIKSVWCR